MHCADKSRNSYMDMQYKLNIYNMEYFSINIKYYITEHSVLIAKVLWKLLFILFLNVYLSRVEKLCVFNKLKVKNKIKWNFLHLFIFFSIYSNHKISPLFRIKIKKVENNNNESNNINNFSIKDIHFIFLSNEFNDFCK